MTSLSRQTAPPRPEERYRIIAVLGRGGMATVHLALLHGASGVNKLVVLKCIRQDLAEQDEFRQMFLDEARLAARLNHPNVVQTFEIVELSHRPVIVMEYLEGQTLASVIERNNSSGQPRIPITLHLRILSEMLSGLEYAHTLCDFDGSPLKMVHRDISPQNIFVTYDGQVKLVDFGIAKALGTSIRTQTGTLKGKIKYMAPEQMLGSPPVDARADVYATGVLLWEAVTRQRLWSGLGDAQIMHQVVHGQIPQVHSVDAGLPDLVNHVCAKAMSVHREERQESAAALQADIERIISELGQRATNRDIADFMQVLYGDLRRETRRLIEARLREPELPGGGRSGARRFPESLRGDALLQLERLPLHVGSASDKKIGLESSSNLQVRENIPSSPDMPRWPTHRRSTLLVALAIVLLCSAVGIGIRSARTRPPATAVATPSETSIFDVPTVPEAPPVNGGLPAFSASGVPSGENRVGLHIRAVPNTAKIFIDGVPVIGNPYHGSLTTDGSSHLLRAEAPGYPAKTKSVVFDGPVDLTIWLEPHASAPSKELGYHGVVPQNTSKVSGDRGAVPHAPTASSSALTKSGPSCEPPYTYDAKGIKRLKLECISERSPRNFLASAGVSRACRVFQLAALV